MRLMRDVPEAAEKIKDGSLSLSVAAKIQTFANKAPEISKKELVEKLENRSTREAEQLFVQLKPEFAKEEKVRAISETLTEITITITKELQSKLDRLKGCMSHVKANFTYSELFEKLADIGLKRYDPVVRALRRKATSPPSAILTQAQKDEIHKRDRTCRICGSTMFLQVDHIIPPNFGGTNDPKNLRLLCGIHNRLEAEKWYGKKKMRSYAMNRHS